MAVRKRGRRRNPRPPTLQSTTIPAPIAGVDTRTPLGNMPVSNCVYAYNIGPSEVGVSTRPGYREHVIGVESVSGLGITTLIPYKGTAGPRLYAVTNEGIWDVTAYATPPVLKYTFTTDTTATAGCGVFVAYVDQAGKEWVFYADSTNGLFECDVLANTWAVYAGITGVVIDAADVAFITVHKQRIWMVARGVSSAVYMPLAAKTGLPTEFHFGTKFLHGGTLVGLWGWSVDGGLGLDDYLVVISSSGDVIPYQGSDPAVADWQTRGNYFVGEVPSGRRIANEYRGDLNILSAYGLIAMSDLLRGVDANIDNESSLSFRIAGVLRERLITESGNNGWEVKFLPALGVLMIAAPKREGFPEVQYVSSLSRKGWSFWRGVPLRSFVEWAGKVYIGTHDNRVCVLDSTRDDLLITPPAAPITNGQAIDFSILLSFQRAGDDGRFKQVQLVRPDFYGESSPEWESKVFYDYENSEITAPTGGAVLSPFAWDAALWDDAFWGGGDLMGFNRLSSAVGMGRSMGIALRGTTSVSSILLSVDVSWTTGHQI